MKFGILYLILLSGYFVTNAQPIIEENFIYNTGTLTQQTTLWTEEPIGATKVQVVEGSLIYPGYPSSGAGNMIFLDGGTSRAGVQRSFPSVSGNGKTLFISFLLNRQDTSELNIAVICKLKAIGSLPKFNLPILKISGTAYKIGISKGGNDFKYYDSLLYTDSSYLIVACYQFCSTPDSLKLWINPELSGSGIPPPNVVYYSNTVDAINLSLINFVPGSTSGNQFIDGLRIDTSWSQAPLPVELSIFTADLYGDKIELNWRTETEVDNYGFDIEKLADGGNSDWNKIAFVEGHGNSNVPNIYSFSDNDIFNNSEIRYRLKQIDTDGKSTYSKEEVIHLLPEKFFLYQNYPNPFNSGTKIRYSIPDIYGNEELNISLKLYNSLGSEIAELANGIKYPGIYEITLDAAERNLSSGPYFYVLKVYNNKSENMFFSVKKFIYLK